MIQEISINNKGLINSYLNLITTENSELTFTNLFMWRKSYNIQYALINDSLCIFAKHGNSPRCVAFPISKDFDKVRNTINELISYFLQSGQKPLIRLSRDDLPNLLCDMFPDKFNIKEDTASFDYVYSVQELTNLTGGKFHAKRNHINKFKALYDYEYKRIDTPEILNECNTLFDKWYELKKDTHFGMQEGREAYYEFTKNFPALDVAGGALYANGQLIAFSFGEPLNSNTVVIHFECADTTYQGAYPMINQQFLEHEWQEYEFVNREEDMGLEGLRKAKQSYHPVKLAKKYIAVYRD